MNAKFNTADDHLPAPLQQPLITNTQSTNLPPWLSDVMASDIPSPETDEFDDAIDAFLPSYANRAPMNQDEFDARYGYKKPKKPPALNGCLRSMPLAYWATKIKYFVPITTWLPKYDIRKNLVADLLGGITIGVMHVPQGIAYAYLAGVPPIIGLYTSLFPGLWYMIFGTSRQNSLGSFAVICLMCGAVVSKQCSAETDQTTEYDVKCATQVASSLACLVGLIHILLAVLRLQVIVTYFSDQLVAGFTTAASFHVFRAQLTGLLGLPKMPSHLGFFYLFRSLLDIIKHLPSANLVTLGLSAGSLLFLAIGKDVINPVIRRHCHIPAPIPFELLLIATVTAISYQLNLHSKYGVAIVQSIPIGLPRPQLPDFTIMPPMITDAFSIALVILAIHISLAKMIAKKLRYTIDSGQEIYALGLSASLSSFFPIHPVACSLGRTLVAVEAGVQTQLSALASAAFLLAVIVYVGQWLGPLPLAVLSSIVIYALKGMLKKFHELATLWPLSKVDFSIWLVSFTVTVVWDVTPGLVVSIVYALMTTVFRTQFPRWHFLGSLPGSNDFRDSERYRDAMQHKGICIFRFDSPLLFINVEKFKNSVRKSLKNAKIPENGDGIVYRHFIIDCSGFTFVDYMGVNALKEIFTEMKQERVLIYFAAAKAPVRESFEKSGFYQYVPKHNFYPTIRDAVALAKKRSSSSTLYLLNQAHIEHNALEEIVCSQPTD